MRVKRGNVSKKRHKKVLKLAKGFRGARSRQFRSANEAVMHALTDAYRDRRLKRRNFRRLWISRINAGARQYGMAYSRFMNGLAKAGINLNRKFLADLAVNQPESFKQLVEQAEAALA